VNLYAALVGMGLAIMLGGQRVNLPILIGAAGVILIGLVLMVIMPETKFHPTPKEDRNTWQHMWHIFREGVGAVRSRPRLISVLLVGFFYGLYSEGFDRLWVKHLLDAFSVPVILGNTQVGFFGLLRAGGMVLSILASRCGEAHRYKQSVGDWAGDVGYHGRAFSGDHWLCAFAVVRPDHRHLYAHQHVP
jgi:MFS transporter, DHA3 family, tetracycline resistance protein